MARTYYAQSDSPGRTMTVGELLEKLQACDPAASVIFRSPFNGAFGPLQAYSIEGVTPTIIPARAEHHPACMSEDEETGEPIEVEAWTQNWHRWEGVVIG